MHFEVGWKVMSLAGMPEYVFGMGRRQSVRPGTFTCLSPADLHSCSASLSLGAACCVSVRWSGLECCPHLHQDWFLKSRPYFWSLGFLPDRFEVLDQS